MEPPPRRDRAAPPGDALSPRPAAGAGGQRARAPPRWRWRCRRREGRREGREGSRGAGGRSRPAWRWRRRRGRGTAGQPRQWAQDGAAPARPQRPRGAGRRRLQLPARSAGMRSRRARRRHGPPRPAPREPSQGCGNPHLSRLRPGRCSGWQQGPSGNAIRPAWQPSPPRHRLTAAGLCPAGPARAANATRAVKACSSSGRMAPFPVRVVAACGASPGTAILRLSSGKNENFNWLGSRNV
ncbi:uncharacterized protein LOC127469249 [Manacus candei]|uniref:uncharacterized protein LOC127469249 n=1 Tax=Manacus candei TaxID=415023 RepID=UPI0022263EFD|nr:uncharacterized protein LOC127469249 [Manacus candei]